ncbi:MAG: VCBS repeat-containing protein [Candidatus Hydrogenedentes bacterium]|nr:VCBS repeat-containing protein [Candidatus Hydrogenedentota bacterium]
MMCLPLLCLAALRFTSQEIPAVYVGVVDPLTAEAATNFVQADLDRDGADDLVLAGMVLFQEAGGFPPERRVPLPQPDAPADIDVWRGALYLRSQNSLAIYRWTQGGWETVVGQPLSWPAQPPDLSEEKRRLQRYLHDVDGNGDPELIAVDPAGIHVFSRNQESEVYAERAVWRILPPLDLVQEEQQQLWPAPRRRLLFPAREMSARFFLQANRISVLSQDLETASSRGYVRTDYSVAAGQAWELDPAASSTQATPSMPAFLRPCRLNNDDVIDYAGGVWQESKASAYPLPVYETWATLDGGATFKVVREPSFQRLRPHCSFLDVDGDGDKDLVSESATLFQGGPREMIAQLLTRSVLDHVLRVYAQESGGFSKAPAVEGQVRINLDAAPYLNGPMFQRYQLGELINFTGDFNGDGWKDVVVREEPERVRLFLSAPGRLGGALETTWSVPGPADIRVYDINHDGRGDLLVQPKQAQQAQTPGSLVYFSREEAS